VPTSRKRTVGARERLRILKRDRYRCTTCGATPALDPAVRLEVDHREPFSLGGSDEDSNLVTLCLPCNRGKGADASLNKEIEADVEALLYRINPSILEALDRTGTATVIANAEDFSRLRGLCIGLNSYELIPSPAVIMGRGARAGPADAIYTVEDNYGTKTLFSVQVSSG
jgi:hypothetical protein